MNELENKLEEDLEKVIPPEMDEELREHFTRTDEDKGETTEDRIPF